LNIERPFAYDGYSSYGKNLL